MAGSVRKEDNGEMMTVMQAGQQAGSLVWKGKGTEGILNLTRKRIKYDQICFLATSDWI